MRGLFFQEAKVSKTSKLLNIAWVLTTFSLMTIGFFRGFDAKMFRILFGLIGASWLIEGVNCYRRNNKKWMYLSDFVVAAACFIAAIWWG